MFTGFGIPTEWESFERSHREEFTSADAECPRTAGSAFSLGTEDEPMEPAKDFDAAWEFKAADEITGSRGA